MKKINKIFFSIVLVLTLGLLCSCDKIIRQGLNDGEHTLCIVHDLEVYKDVPSRCNIEGYTIYECKVCGYRTERVYKDLLEHTPSEPDDYVSLQKCSICGEYFRQKPESELLDTWVFTVDEAKIEEALGYAEQIELLLEENKGMEPGVEKDAVAEEIDELLSKLDEIEFDSVQDYYLAELKFYINCQDQENIDNYDYYDSVYNQLYTTVRQTIYKIFYSEFQTEIFGDDPEELAELEEEYKYFNDEKVKELEDNISDLEYKLYYTKLSEDELWSGISELISLRNELAQRNGYDNFYEYASAENYGRSFTTDELETFRNFMKNEFVHAFGNGYVYMMESANRITASDEQFCSDIADTSIWGKDPTMVNHVVDYMKTIKSEDYDIDLFGVVNEAFKNGRIFVGDPEVSEYAAFSRTVLDENYPIAFFTNDYYYGAATVFVHESGHMLSGDNMAFDFDLAEIQSQGNEMLFLVYMSQFASNIEKMAEHSYLETLTLLNGMLSVMDNLVVDEFEYCLYTDYSSLDPKYEDGIDHTEYEDLYMDIVKSYSFTFTQDDPMFEGIRSVFEDQTKTEYSLGLYNFAGYDFDQWTYYFCNRSCYEISYAISYIPTIELYIDAVEDYDNALHEYFLLQSYSRNKDFEGDGHFKSVIEYSELSSVLTKDIYEKILKYFSPEEEE